MQHNEHMVSIDGRANVPEVPHVFTIPMAAEIICSGRKQPMFFEKSETFMATEPGGPKITSSGIKRFPEKI